MVFAAGLTALAFAAGPAGLALAWMMLGVGMGFGLYEAAFATVAGLYGRGARNAITGITLFGGFASTVGWPTSAIFIDAFGQDEGMKVRAEADPEVVKGLELLPQAKALADNARKIVAEHNAAPAFNR